MKKYAHNHPAVRAWTPELQLEKENRETMERKQFRKVIAQKIETLIAVTFLIGSLPTIAWLSENNAPIFITLGSSFSMIGFALAILMEEQKG
jgi:hypothetical protein